MRLSILASTEPPVKSIVPVTDELPPAFWETPLRLVWSPMKMSVRVLPPVAPRSVTVLLAPANSIVPEARLLPMTNEGVFNTLVEPSLNLAAVEPDCWAAPTTIRLVAVMVFVAAKVMESFLTMPGDDAAPAAVVGRPT